jgi:hypothetical protein
MTENRPLLIIRATCEVSFEAWHDFDGRSPASAEIKVKDFMRDGEGRSYESLPILMDFAPVHKEVKGQHWVVGKGSELSAVLASKEFQEAHEKFGQDLNRQTLTEGGKPLIVEVHLPVENIGGAIYVAVTLDGVLALLLL